MIQHLAAFVVAAILEILGCFIDDRAGPGSVLIVSGIILMKVSTAG